MKKLVTVIAFVILIVFASNQKKVPEINDSAINQVERNYDAFFPMYNLWLQTHKNFYMHGSIETFAKDAKLPVEVFEYFANYTFDINRGYIFREA